MTIPIPTVQMTQGNKALVPHLTKPVAVHTHSPGPAQAPGPAVQALLKPPAVQALPKPPALQALHKPLANNSHLAANPHESPAETPAFLSKAPADVASKPLLLAAAAKALPLTADTNPQALATIQKTLKTTEGLEEEVEINPLILQLTQKLATKETEKTKPKQMKILKILIIL
ncbi:hypothetical protein PTTG_02449 [Puccinia triticina 1-1 BBBD Race 1]|uniref:Uncharacterized protein n=1 Tax=Puccinia triticina (isolate 1-1 / race 1 (BBBD)) TaxID=630390 RepID=A0A180H2H6_PUCT1|nr:hypothetical protein PTTG_02449 [Puccinia triticina 1-1 BBBD Race 1]